MPVTKEHAMCAEYLRENGELVAKLAERLGVHIEEAWASVEIGDSEFTKSKPGETRVDGVLVYRNAEGNPVLVVAFEIQRSFDAKKFIDWPFCAASLMCQYDCGTIVLVLVSSPALAQAYREREYAHGSFPFCPYILDATTVPEAEASTPAGEAIVAAWVRSDMKEEEVWKKAARQAVEAINREEEDIQTRKKLYDRLIDGYGRLAQREEIRRMIDIIADLQHKRLGLPNYTEMVREDVRAEEQAKAALVVAEERLRAAEERLQAAEKEVLLTQRLAQLSGTEADKSAAEEAERKLKDAQSKLAQLRD